MSPEELKTELDSTKMLAAVLLAKGCQEDKDYNTLNLVNVMADMLPELPKVQPKDSLASRMMLIKVPWYGVKITPPDWLIYMIDVCAGDHPGFMQLIYKELLTFINNSCYAGTGIPENYKIRAIDFINCFRNAYPILLDPSVYDKYSKMWDEQKKERENSAGSDNKCDTKEYWMEVIYKE